MKMQTLQRLSLVLPLLAMFLSGCVLGRVEHFNFKQPDRTSQLDAYDVFVGDWDWEAKTVYPESVDTTWKGRAKWEWTLDRRCLRGEMSAKGGESEFEATGIWSWHPKRKKYIWWMFNNWGYPQQGTAKYCPPCAKCGGSWRMKYKSIGLDGSTSYGRYSITVVDPDTLDWTMTEWALPLHLIKKTEMKGAYKRRP